MNKNFAKMSTFFAALFLPVSIFAWNAVGHMVIANIAYANLTSTAKANVDSLVASFNKEYPTVQTFAQLADWADTLRDQHVDYYAHWHYTNTAISTDGTPTLNVMDSDNAVWAVGELTPVLKYSQANEFERARALALFSHVVSDLHQPLHTVENFTANHPKGDRGGNSYGLIYDNQNSNAHGLWDSAVGIFSWTISDDEVAQDTTMIETLFPKNAFTAAQVNDANPNDWVNEGIQNATNYVYDTPEGKPVSNDYITAGRKVAGQEAALAGYRLAAMLNAMMG